MDRLRAELTEQRESEKSALLKDLTKMKEEELIAVNQGWEVKVNELLRQVRFTLFLVAVVSKEFHVFFC